MWSLVGGDDDIYPAERMVMAVRQWMNDPAGQQHVDHGTFDTGGGCQPGCSGMLEANDERSSSRGDPDHPPRRTAQDG